MSILEPGTGVLDFVDVLRTLLDVSHFVFKIKNVHTLVTGNDDSFCDHFGMGIFGLIKFRKFCHRPNEIIKSDI